MILSLTRRGLAVGTTSMLAMHAVPVGADGPDALASIEQRHGGRLGVFALDTGSGRTLTHRADERFMLCSTFKGPLAGLVLSRVDAGRDSLAAEVRYGRADLVGHSPVTAAHVASGVLTVGALCSAILLFSDNGAANLLLKRVGGPAALTAYLRALGDQTTRCDRYELAAGEGAGVLDTTTPRAICTTARTLLLGNVLSPASAAMLESWMRDCQVGASRLRAAFPPAWIAADRTGTGDGLCNDYAIVRRAGRDPLIMAAYHDAPGMEATRQEAVLREAGAVVVAWSG